MVTWISLKLNVPVVVEKRDDESSASDDRLNVMRRNVNVFDDDRMNRADEDGVTVSTFFTVPVSPSTVNDDVNVMYDVSAVVCVPVETWIVFV